MNQTQSIALELLKNFIDICDKLKLKWFLINGSALGAIKYKGFIPWDDDIDVGLMRNDYEIFLEKAQSMLNNNIFLQNYRTDKYFPHTYSKLRNSDTTFIENGVRHLDMNHGMYIDIFPLDFYPENYKEQVKLERSKKLLEWKTLCAFDDRSEKKVIIRNAFFRMLGYHKKTQKNFERLERIFTSSNASSNYICNHGDRIKSKRVLSHEIYGDGSIAFFEGIDVIVPEKYDQYLTFKYGDWRSDPPKDKQISHHEAVICDADTPYTNYMTEK